MKYENHNIEEGWVCIWLNDELIEYQIDYNQFWLWLRDNTESLENSFMYVDEKGSHQERSTLMTLKGLEAKTGLEDHLIDYLFAKGSTLKQETIAP